MRGGEEIWEILFCCCLVFGIGQKNSMVSWEKQALESSQSELEFQLCHLLALEMETCFILLGFVAWYVAGDIAIRIEATI